MDGLEKAFADVIGAIDDLSSYRQDALPKLDAQIDRLATLAKRGEQAIRLLDEGNRAEAHGPCATAAARTRRAGTHPTACCPHSFRGADFASSAGNRRTLRGRHRGLLDPPKCPWRCSTAGPGQRMATASLRGQAPRTMRKLALPVTA